MAAFGVFVACASGVPRRHRLISRGYPESVSDPSPKSVATSAMQLAAVNW